MPLPYLCNIFFFFNDTPTTEIYTLSLHDALPICRDSGVRYAREPHDGQPSVLAESPHLAVAPLAELHADPALPLLHPEQRDVRGARRPPVDDDPLLELLEGLVVHDPADL